ncbi:hypothetical protein FJZ36_15950 [Candidatus Poribacteria bacterium]|nr:hypothetical protein [Candidatus Poribacteria bacterium]
MHLAIPCPYCQDRTIKRHVRISEQTRCQTCGRLIEVRASDVRVSKAQSDALVAERGTHLPPIWKLEQELACPVPRRAVPRWERLLGSMVAYPFYVWYFFYKEYFDIGAERLPDFGEILATVPWVWPLIVPAGLLVGAMVWGSDRRRGRRDASLVRFGTATCGRVLRTTFFMGVVVYDTPEPLTLKCSVG